jgi:hypothetical protein
MLYSRSTHSRGEGTWFGISCYPVYAFVVLCALRVLCGEKVLYPVLLSKIIFLCALCGEYVFSFKVLF